jgi:hypothetical protein
MGRSSLLGLEHTVIERAGWYCAALGPGDNSDSGSDGIGLEDPELDDPVERRPQARGIPVRRPTPKGFDVDPTLGTFRSGDDVGTNGIPQDDEDPDLAFIDSALADGPVEEESEDEDGEGRGRGDEDDNIPGVQVTSAHLPKSLPKTS